MMFRPFKRKKFQNNLYRKENKMGLLDKLNQLALEENYKCMIYKKIATKKSKILGMMV